MTSLGTLGSLPMKGDLFYALLILLLYIDMVASGHTCLAPGGCNDTMNMKIIGVEKEDKSELGARLPR